MLVGAEKEYLARETARLGLFTQMGQGCYVMIRLPMSDTFAYRKLMAQGVMVRTMTGFRFPNWIRVSVGKHQAMRAFIKALEGIL